MSVVRIAGTRENAIKNVVAYARVSTLQEEQNESFENQKEFYETYIKSVPSWRFAGIYADHGLSGRETKNRTEFNRMIEDAKKGKIDIILVKSISRFSRNVVDAQKYVQLLRGLEVEVRFDRENLSSFNRNTEMALATLAMCAEQESKSISDNVRWTFERLARQGIRHLGNNNVLGYDEVDGVLAPNESAEIIRFIFESYASGMSIGKIIQELECRGVKTMRGRERFNPASINYILYNEIYTGDRIIQKQPPKDFYTKKPDYTKEYESFFIQDDHPAIISRELWDKVHTRLNAQNAHMTFGSYFLKGRIYCGDCGALMKRISYIKDGKRQKVWKCAERLKFAKGNGCQNDVITETELAEILCGHLGIEFSGLENLNECDFTGIKKVRIYKDGRIEIE